MSVQGKGNGICKAARRGLSLPVFFPLILSACHLVIGLEQKDLPEKEGTPCSGSEDCDDLHECTQDMCEVESGACRHYVKSLNTLCREKTTERFCDVASEYCDGTSLDCPAEIFEPSTLLCRESEGQCDEPEYCTGSSALCPEDAFSLDTKTCDDSDECTFDDRCDGEGRCLGINAIHDVERISAGPWAHFTCVLLSTDEVRCWGSNPYQQLGDGTTEDRAIPVLVQGLEREEITTFGAGGRHVCVILTEGRLMCWGLGDSGQLGDGNSGFGYTASSPVEVIGTPDGWRQVAGGYLYTCAVQENDAAYCWGKNDHGQLGTGTLDDRVVPTEVTGLGGVSSITGGCYHTCAVHLSGAVMCWGRNTHGQLGSEAAGDHSLVPAAVEGIPSRVSAVTLGTLHTCALLEDGGVMCWGSNEFGQLGAGDVSGGSVPVAVTGLSSGVRAIASAYEHTCALMDEGDLMCWGHNDESQIGDGTTGGDRNQPVSVVNLPPDVVSVAPGAFHTCAILEDTTARCWGHNVYGELGDGTNVENPEPVVVRCR